MKIVATKIDRNGKKIHLYRLNVNRNHYAIGNKANPKIIKGIGNAFAEWDKLYDYRKTK